MLSLLIEIPTAYLQKEYDRLARTRGAVTAAECVRADVEIGCLSALAAARMLHPMSLQFRN